MVNISTNINKANNHLSLQLIEHNKTTKYDVGNSGTGTNKWQSYTN